MIALKFINRRSKHCHQALFSATHLLSTATSRDLQQRVESTLSFVEAFGKAGSAKHDQETACVVHGLLGQGKNLRNFSRKLAQEAAAYTERDWRCLLVDQRNHGGSVLLPGLEGPNTIEASAADLARFLHAQLPGSSPALVIGHSLGGKVALAHLRLMAKSESKALLPKQVWVLDSTPGVLNEGATNGESGTMAVLEALRSIPLPVPSREWLYKHMGARKGFTVALQQWLGSSLVPDSKGSGGLVWAFNIDGAEEMWKSYRETCVWDVIESPPDGVDVHIVKAGNSSGLKSDIPRLQAAEASTGGQTRFHVLENAGHWLHADNPDGLVRLMMPYIFSAYAAGAKS